MVLPRNLGQMGCGCPNEGWLGTGDLAVAHPAGGPPAFPQLCLGLATLRWVQVLVQDLPQQQLEWLFGGPGPRDIGSRESRGGEGPQLRCRRKAESSS